MRMPGCVLEEHHRLDPYPIPKERMPLYVNEPSAFCMVSRASAGSSSRIEESSRQSRDSSFCRSDRVFMPLIQYVQSHSIYRSG